MAIDVPQEVFRDVIFMKRCSFPAALCVLCVSLNFVGVHEAKIFCDHLVTDTA